MDKINDNSKVKLILFLKIISLFQFSTSKSDYFSTIPEVAESNNITITWNSTKEILAIMEEKQDYVIEIKYFLKEVFK